MQDVLECIDLPLFLFYQRNLCMLTKMSAETRAQAESIPRLGQIVTKSMLLALQNFQAAFSARTCRTEASRTYSSAMYDFETSSFKPETCAISD